MSSAFENSRVFDQYTQYIETLSQDPKLQLQIALIYEVSLKDAIETLTNVAQNYMFNDHDIIESPIYNDDID